MSCRLCKHDIDLLFSGKLINYVIKYYICNNCSLLQTESPYWLSEAYEKSINDTDVGMLQRNFYNCAVTIYIYKLLNLKNSRLLDYGGGYGVLVRLLRDDGIDAYWNDAHTTNLFSPGFEGGLDEKYGLVTAFEVVEHLTEPEKFLQNIFKITDNLLISTELVPKPIPNILDWDYYGVDHGQHINFFQEDTFEFIATKYNKNYVKLNNTYHLFTNKNISFFIKLFFNFKKIIYIINKKLGKSFTLIDFEYLKNNKITKLKK